MQRNKRTFRVIGKRQGTNRRLPKTLEMEFDTFGASSALKRFQWSVEEQFGRKAINAYPVENIRIEEI